MLSYYLRLIKSTIEYNTKIKRYFECIINIFGKIIMIMQKSLFLFYTYIVIITLIPFLYTYFFHAINATFFYYMFKYFWYINSNNEYTVQQTHTTQIKKFSFDIKFCQIIDVQNLSYVHISEYLSIYQLFYL